jgi:hypothetical protein
VKPEEQDILEALTELERAGWGIERWGWSLRDTVRAIVPELLHMPVLRQQMTERQDELEAIRDYALRGLDHPTERGETYTLVLQLARMAAGHGWSTHLVVVDRLSTAQTELNDWKIGAATEAREADIARARCRRLAAQLSRIHTALDGGVRGGLVRGQGVGWIAGFTVGANRLREMVRLAAMPDEAIDIPELTDGRFRHVPTPPAFCEDPNKKPQGGDDDDHES